MKLFIKQSVILLLLVFGVGISLSAERYTISGYVSDISSGETLLSAAVFDNLTEQGTVTNNYGFYSLSLPQGDVALQYTYIGYAMQQIDFTLTKDTVINIRLESANMLQEVVVMGNRSELGVRGSQISAIEVPIGQIKKVPTLFGENDLIKALQLLPGVQSGTEGSAGMYVRGGGPDENLLLLDGVPVYNVNHMMGFFSVFNSDAIKNVTLYKGSFPARFGGRLSSVVDIRMKDGNDKKMHGNFSIGAISSKIQLEGPIWKEKTTFNISARRTYWDLIAQPLIKAAARAEEKDTRIGAGYYFYDVNAKFTHKFSDRDKLYLSTYFGDDAIYTKANTLDKTDEDYSQKKWMKMNWDWGNLITALRWNHVLNHQLFMNTTASFTRYRSDLGVGTEMETIRKEDDVEKKEFQDFRMNYKSGIQDWTVKVDFDYEPTPIHKIKFGTNYTYHTFSPDVYSMKMNSKDDNQPINIDTIVGAPKVFSHETLMYVEDNISISDLLKINAGLHFSGFHVQQENYYSLQPRLGVRLMLNDNLSVKAGYAAMKQYVHMLSNNSISLPTDLWVPVTKRIKPMKSHQVALGVFYNIKNVGDFSIEGYYKAMNNLLEYKDGASFMGSSTNWEDKVSMGRGVAYGVEFLYQRTFGNTTGWIGYTWAKADRIFDKPGNIINNGKKFPAKYDRRHDLSLTVAHTFSERIDVAASWVVSSGNTGTFGFQRYNFYPPTRNNSYQSFNHIGTLTHIEKRNNYRFNTYHRMDIGINFHKITKRGNKRTWNISIYNVYNHLNPFMVYTTTDYEKNPQTGASKQTNKLMQVSMFPIIPSVSYSLSF